jgi:hypothetical protein
LIKVPFDRDTASLNSLNIIIKTKEVSRFKKNLPKYRWQHLKKRGAELGVTLTHNSEPKLWGGENALF